MMITSPCQTFSTFQQSILIKVFYIKFKKTILLMEKTLILKNELIGNLMNIKETIDKTSILAKFELNDIEKEKFKLKFEQISEYINIIDDLDLENVAPISKILEFDNGFREDISLKELRVDEALPNASIKKQRFL